MKSFQQAAIHSADSVNTMYKDLCLTKLRVEKSLALRGSRFVRMEICEESLACGKRCHCQVTEKVLKRTECEIL